MSSSDVSRALAQPVRYRVLARYLASIGLVVAVLRLPPILLSWACGDWHFMVGQVLVSAGLLLICLPVTRIWVPEGIRDNEVMVITSLSFAFTALLEALPFIGEGLTGIDALFETVSGVTTTGLSTLTGLQHYSPALLFSRAWMQWYGGLGVVAFSIALLFLDRGMAAHRLAMGDITDSRDILGNARSHALKLLIIYSALSVIAILALWVAGLDPLSAVTHALSGISTGGFSIYDNSLAAIDSAWLQVLVTVIGVLGAVALPLYYHVFKRGFKELATESEALALPVISLGVVGVLFLCINADVGNVWSSLKQAVVMGISAQTTTGFANADIGPMNAGAKLTLITSMIIGGSMGSTAGGIKILRFLIVLRLIQLFIVRTALPAHAVLERRLCGDKLEADEIERVLMLIMIFLGTVLLSWFAFLVMGYDPLNALLEVVSACSTTGLSSGITRTALEPSLKAVLIIDMLLGRVEFLAMLVFLYPRTWIKIGSKT
ncbi:TrkH family potassium uptake protein [Methylomonas methanica]|uniref:Cation transporter n=1 Tax=Methylomonas methanica (strain DSM 25384 / MC09) TaxID=857087 RepID=G0A0F5_METMM|nr:potassium transporter TrkG [Methylomonas methanica]AEG02461.1 cation transporter [Methylomonas methanica MC09]